MKRVTNKSLNCLGSLLGSVLALLATDTHAQTASTLYGVTGDGGTPAETLFTLSKSDASSTLVLSLGNGTDGEEIAFNPDDGLLYHASGRDAGRILETINPSTLAISNIPLSGDTNPEVSGLTYEGAGVFIAGHQNASDGISTLTTAGVSTLVGSSAATLTGLAYIGSDLYAVARSDDELRTIDPLTGGTLTSVTITLAGETVIGATGLAVDPVDNTLWALLKTEFTFPRDPGERALVQLNPTTGAATLVGFTDVVGMAGIAFVSGSGHTVTPSVGTGMGSISPSTPVDVIDGHTTSFTLIPDPGFEADSVGGTCGGTLNGNTFTTNAITADCTVIANFAPASTTQLYGVTGDGGFPAETLFQLSTADASSTFFLTLGAGDDGEEIAFNRDDGLMYHISGHRTGGGVQAFESINLGTMAITPIGSSGSNYDEATGMTYAGGGVFIFGDRDGGLFQITTGGVVSNIGSTAATLTGLAYIGDTLYSVARNDNLLRIIDDSNANTLSSVTISLAGFTLSGATGLTTNPDDNSLWAILKTGPSSRAIATVDPATGVASLVGATDVPGMAGIAFAFAPCNPCDVTPSVGGGPGTITPSTVQSVPSGNTTQFTLTPAVGHHVDLVDGTCGGSLASDVFTTAPIFNHCEVIAYFAINVYDLVYSAGAGGAISGDSNQSVEHGQNGTQVTAVPNAFHHFVDWSDGVLTTSRTETNVTADLSVTANFAIDTYTVTSSVGSGLGTISPLGGQTINHGSTAQFTLTPDVGYHIDSIGGNCGGSLNGNVFTTNAITANCTVVANFAINTYSLMYSAGAGGTLTGDTSQVVQHGQNGTQVTAVANANHHFVDWSDGVLTAARTEINVTANLSVTANFAIDTYTVTSSVGSGTGTISPLGGQTIDHGSTAQFTLAPGTGYHIDSVGGSCGGSLNGNTYTTSAVTANCTVVANFAINTYTLSYTAGANGSVSGDTIQMVDHGQNGTEVTATPNANHHFVDWSDGVLTAARTEVNVTADLSVTANFAVDTFTVTSSVGSGQGAISPLGAQQVDHGETTQFTLTPDTGYHIDSVGGTCGGSLNSGTFTTNAITANCTVIANFAINTYTVTSSVGTGRGTISPLGGQSLDHGDTAVFTLTPDIGYHIDPVTGSCGGTLDGDSYTTNAVTDDCTVVANFAVDTYTLSYTAGAGGTITGDANQVVDHGQDGTEVIATPNANYHFVDWSDGVLTAARTDTNITANLSVTANFAIDTHTVTSSVGSGQGTISPLGGQEVDHGETTAFTLTPDVGYHIDSVSGSCGGTLDGDTFTTNPITGDCTVVANFAINSYTVTSSVGAGLGAISPLGEQDIEHGDTATYTLTPDTGYHIDSVGGTCGGTLDGDSYTTNAVTDDCTVVANFAINTYTVTSSVSAGLGAISPSGDQEIEHGDTATYTLTPDTGYHVDSVGGTCGGTLDGDSYTTSAVTAACTVIANFAINSYTLTYTAGTGGTISGDTSQIVEHGDDGTEVTAVPDTGQAFVDWSDGVMTASRTETNVTADISVTANFAPNEHTVTSSVGSGTGTITPLGDQTVNHGETIQFTLTPGMDFIIGSVGGTCGGSLVGSTYTTNPVNSDCTVIANFVDQGDQIMASGFE